MIAPIHGGQLPHIATRFNIPIERLVDFSANINPEGPPPGVVEAIRHALTNPTTLTAYPDLESTALRTSIATYANTPANAIAVANGFVPLLEAAIRTLNVKRCLLPVPAFNEYRHTLERNHIHIEPYALSPEVNFAYDSTDPPTLIARAIAGHHDTILLANPQNPTGVLTPGSTMLDLLHEATANNIRLLIDEAFMDYTPTKSLIPETHTHPNLVVFRSVTKFHGIPGLRAAYCVSHPDTSKALTRNVPPWPVTTLATEGVIAALADQAYAQATITLNRTRRTQLESALKTLNIPTTRSSANYLLLKLSTQSPEQLWEHLIQQHGIVLRLCTNYESLPPTYFRAAVRNEQDNARLIAALALV
ncbi:pyridoxal phosphate-dependent aminotransferase [Granulicella sibirica]|uniref:Aminotransferase n=1 Tax=Granulicella sibirica TaxID=2479048 RepID=A0A4Q0T176_9BACT|nr:aminotransferase class I/II-fold pyridoxal phosphate-dependent enzyme [Granulicella sibirica]RXH56907.1 L-threonine 3-O-phosphate decarboxylase [Granulicella sibirica]